MAIQYCDYPFDNHKVSFDIMKNALGNQRTQSLTFGGLVTCCTFVPVINLLIMPVAVCGATVMWVENYRNGLRFNMNSHSSSQTGIDVHSENTGIVK